MKMATLWYLRYWFGYRSTSRKMTELVTSLSPKLIVGDEEFSSVSLAIRKGIPHALISDELQLGFNFPLIFAPFAARELSLVVGDTFAILPAGASPANR